MPPILSTAFLLFLVGSTSAGLVFSRNSDGSFSAVSEKHDHDENIEMPGYNEDESGGETRAFSETHLPANTGNHIAQFALDDEDLSLVQEYFEDQNINKTGQLRYSTLSIVEKALIKDIVRIIMKDDEYMILLNKPTFPEVVQMVRSMLREPIQEVLHQQIWNKVLAVQAYYNKFYKPLNNPETKREALEFLKHLKTASEDQSLTVDDTVKLNEKVQTLAFLIQENEFDEKLNELESTFKGADNGYRRSRSMRKSAQVTHPPAGIAPTTPDFVSENENQNEENSAASSHDNMMTPTSRKFMSGNDGPYRLGQKEIGKTTAYTTIGPTTASTPPTPTAPSTPPLPTTAHSTNGPTPTRTPPLPTTAHPTNGPTPTRTPPLPTTAHPTNGPTLQSTPSGPTTNNPKNSSKNGNKTTSFHFPTHPPIQPPTPPTPNIRKFMSENNESHNEGKYSTAPPTPSSPTTEKLMFKNEKQKDVKHGMTPHHNMMTPTTRKFMSGNESHIEGKYPTAPPSKNPSVPTQPTINFMSDNKESHNEGKHPTAPPTPSSLTTEKLMFKNDEQKDGKHGMTSHQNMMTPTTRKFMSENESHNEGKYPTAPPSGKPIVPTQPTKKFMSENKESRNKGENLTGNPTVPALITPTTADPKRASKNEKVTVTDGESDKRNFVPNDSLDLKSTSNGTSEIKMKSKLMAGEEKPSTNFSGSPSDSQNLADTMISDTAMSQLDPGADY